MVVRFLDSSLSMKPDGELMIDLVRMIIEYRLRMVEGFFEDG